MNEIQKVGETINACEYMTSKEIAEITGKPHSDLLKAIRLMEVSWIKVNGGKFSLVEYTDAKGEKRPMYQLNKTECLYIATKFNDEARAKLVIRWEELEKEKRSGNFVIPSTFSEALMLAAKQAEEIENQQKQITSMKPKVEYFDEIVDRNGLTNFRDTAKLFGVSEKALIFFLIDKKYIYRDQKGKLKPIARYVGNYLELKEWAKGEKAGTQTLVTAKGRDHFLKLINNVKL